MKTQFPAEDPNGQSTLPKILVRNSRLRADDVAMRHKVNGVWRQYTWQVYHDHVKHFALGLISLGLKAGDRIAIVGDPTPHWYWSEVAVMATGGVVVGILSDTPADHMTQLLEHCGASILIAKDQEQVDKGLSIKSRVADLTKIIYWDDRGLNNYTDPSLLSFDEVTALGREYERTRPDLWSESVARGVGTDRCLICYTSGTTVGRPKAAVFNHESIIAAASSLADLGLVKPSDNYVPLLSPATILEQQVGVTGGMLVPLVVNFPEKPESAVYNLTEIGPHFVVLLPRVAEQLIRTTSARIERAGRLNRFCYKHAMALGRNMLDRRLNGNAPSLLQRCAHVLTDLIILRPVRDTLGLAKARVALTGGDTLDVGATRFFYCIGSPLLQIYCLTECPGAVVQRLDELDLGSVGRATPGHELQISRDGEILVRGVTMFDGYYRDAQADEERLRNGWFHTGDAGIIDDLGRVIVTGRMADLEDRIVGTTYSPEQIEAKLRLSPYIEDAFVTKKKGEDYLISFIGIDFTNVSAWATRKGLSHTTFEDLSQKTEVFEIIRDEIGKINSILPEPVRIRRFGLLRKRFEVSGGELTLTGKPRRSYVKEKYQDLLNEL